MKITPPDIWIKNHHDHLILFALEQIPDPKIAENLVHETFSAALKSGASFSNQSAQRKWLTAILKNKLTDHKMRTNTTLDITRRRS